MAVGARRRKGHIIQLQTVPSAFQKTIGYECWYVQHKQGLKLELNFESLVRLRRGSSLISATRQHQWCCWWRLHGSTLQLLHWTVARLLWLTGALFLWPCWYSEEIRKWKQIRKMPQERIHPLKIKTSSCRCSRTSATSTASRSFAAVSHTHKLGFQWPGGGRAAPGLKPARYLSSENLQTLLSERQEACHTLKICGTPLSSCRRVACGGFHTHANKQSLWFSGGWTPPLTWTLLMKNSNLQVSIKLIFNNKVESQGPLSGSNPPRGPLGVAQGPTPSLNSPDWFFCSLRSHQHRWSKTRFQSPGNDWNCCSWSLQEEGLS